MRLGFDEILNKIALYVGDVKNKTILDIGAGAGVLANSLTKMGAIVTAIDIKNIDRKNLAFKYIKIPFEYFNTTGKKQYFDIAIAENVLPFLVDKEYTIRKLLDTADVLVFNVWGERHVWKKNRWHFTSSEIEKLKKIISNNHEILFYQEDEYNASPDMDPTKIVHWHEYNFIIKRKIQ